MENVLAKAISAVRKSKLSFCKFLSPNDTGSTRSHQSGIHIAKNAWSLFFDVPPKRGSNQDVAVKVKYQGDESATDSRVIYYGAKKNEIRLTRLHSDFPYRGDEAVGDLFIIAQNEGGYEAFVLSSDEDIDEFQAATLTPLFQHSSSDRIKEKIRQYVELLKGFPGTEEISATARTIYNEINEVTPRAIIENPDKTLIGWIEVEFELFKAIEESQYTVRSFGSVAELVDIANTILNRRKSRAGKALENHLAEMFRLTSLKFGNQVRTEDARRPDFIFPGGKEYHSENFDSSKLFFLGAKTTCKERWAQILKEGDRITTKHLFTLQQGISANQLAEMERMSVKLVVPRDYIESFPEEHRKNILSLKEFVGMVAASQKP